LVCHAPRKEVVSMSSAAVQRKAWNDAMRATVGASGISSLPLEAQQQHQLKNLQQPHGQNQHQLLLQTRNRRSDRNNNNKQNRRKKARKASLNSHNNGDGDHNQQQQQQQEEEYQAAVWAEALEEVDPNLGAGGDGVGGTAMGGGGGDDDDDDDEEYDIMDELEDNDDDDNEYNNNGEKGGGGGGNSKKKKGKRPKKRRKPGSAATLVTTSSSRKKGTIGVLPKRFLPRTLGSILMEEANVYNSYNNRGGGGSYNDGGSAAIAFVEAEARIKKHSQFIPSSRRKFCPVTGLEGIYTEPKSGIPYATVQALEQIRERPPPWMILGGTPSYWEAAKTLRQEE